VFALLLPLLLKALLPESAAILAMNVSTEMSSILKSNRTTNMIAA
jgi:hypothetical protein